MNKLKLAVAAGALALGAGIANASAEGESDDAALTSLGQESVAVVDTVPIKEASPASEGKDRETAARRGSRIIEEIVVTAQKREQSLIEVPISVSAFSVDKLDAQGVVEVRQMDKITPGLTFNEVLGYSVVFLRGVGTDAFLPSADPSVPIYIDGFNQAVVQGVSNTLGRIERVEVLKGPQGTLFGRNALGGAINIVTQAPRDDVLSGDLKLEAGNYSRRNIDMYVNVPLSHGLAASLAGFYDEKDPFYRNEIEGVPETDETAKAARLRLRWDASDTFWIDFGASYQEGSAQGSLVQEMTKPSSLVGQTVPADTKLDRRVRHNVRGGAGTESHMFTFSSGWELPWFDTKLLVSQQELDVTFARIDFDASPLPLVSFDGGNSQKGVRQFSEQFTAELQFLSNSNSAFSEWLEWVGGIYYLKSEAGGNPVEFHVAQEVLASTPFSGLTGKLDNLLAALKLGPLSNGVTLLSYGVLETESLSGYLQGTAALTDTLRITLGGRVDTETRNLVGSRLGARLPVDELDVSLLFFDVPEVTTDRFSPRLAVSWFARDEVNVYASVSRGYLSPTYSSINFFAAPDLVEQEKSVAYELGMKASLLDGNLQINSAIFQTDLSNIITGFFGLTSGGIVQFDNSGDGRIRGAEIEGQWVPMPDMNPGLGVTTAASYLDAKYTRYPDGRGFDEITGLSFGDGGLSPLPSRDFSGNRIPRTAKLTLTLGASQKIQVGEGDIEFGADIYYNDGYYFSAQNSDLEKQLAYQLVSARISYFYYPWKLQITAFGENITDEKYLLQAMQQEFGRTQTLSAPATGGLRIKWSF